MFRFHLLISMIKIMISFFSFCRKDYPYGYGEMLHYTPEVGYKLSSGYEKLHTKQPYKYSYDHGYIPLTPVTYAKHAGIKKH